MQEMTSQKIKRVCDGCGFEKEYEMVNASEENARDFMEWYTIVREFPNEQTGRIDKVMVQAHKIECVPAAATKILLITERTNNQSDGIDLSSLQVRTN